MCREEILNIIIAVCDTGPVIYKPPQTERHCHLQNYNMKFLVVLAVAVACASADVSHILSANADVPIIRNEYVNNPDGSFQSVYETGNGIYSQASGVVKNPNSEYPAQEIVGAYKYTSPDGTPVEVSYVANENGFVAQSPNLPVGPPIPELIQRSLAYIAANPPKSEPASAYQGAQKALVG